MGISNVVPKLCTEIVAAARRSDTARVAELQPLIEGLIEVVKSGPPISTLKFLAARLRGSEVGYRAPYLPLTPEEETTVVTHLEPLLPRLAPFLSP